jgi:transcriptional activator Myb
VLSIRWHYVLKPTITREPWTENEDNAILHLQAAMGNRWSHIAKLVPGRCVS